MNVIILLVYYEKYLENSILEISKIAASMHGDCKVIVVLNNDNIVVKDEIDNFIFIKGDNSNYEFSGWDVGINFAKSEFGNNIKNYVLANDTFCHHRRWNIFTRYNFIYNFNYFSKNNLFGIIGDKNSLGVEYKLLNIINAGWVSTYLFLLSGDIVNNSDFKINIIDQYWNKFIDSVDDDEIVFKKDVDINLSEHINLWLYPKKNDSGWYNASKVNIEKRKKKIECIMNEKLLSSNIIGMGGNVYNLNEKGLFIFFPLIRNFIKLFFKKRR